RVLLAAVRRCTETGRVFPGVLKDNNLRHVRVRTSRQGPAASRTPVRVLVFPGPQQEMVAPADRRGARALRRARAAVRHSGRAVYLHAVLRPCVVRGASCVVLWITLHLSSCRTSHVARRTSLLPDIC